MVPLCAHVDGITIKTYLVFFYLRSGHTKSLQSLKLGITLYIFPLENLSPYSCRACVDNIHFSII